MRSILRSSSISIRASAWRPPFNKTICLSVVSVLKRRLLNLAVGELAALCTFGLLYHVLGLGTASASFAAFFYLNFILLQGSLYWAYRYILLRKRKSPSHKGVLFWRASRCLSTISMVLIGIMIPFLQTGRGNRFWACVAFVFGIIEYINYFWYRLSYGKSGFDIRLLMKTKPQKSSMAKLIGETRSRPKELRAVIGGPK